MSDNEVQEEDYLLIGFRSRGCRVLGPGLRYVIWVQGCLFSCEGCIADDLRDPEGGFPVPVSALCKDIVETPEIEGITISGGEPFLQARELAYLVTRIRTERDLGVIVYSGFEYEVLKRLSEEDEGVRAFLSCIDLLIDGKYQKNRDPGYGLKGSDNQRTILLTDRYKDSLSLYHDPGSIRKSELFVEDGRTIIAGVPAKDRAEKWKLFLKSREEESKDLEQEKKQGPL